jgi:hypothetical protein
MCTNASGGKLKKTFPELSLEKTSLVRRVISTVRT